MSPASPDNTPPAGKSPDLSYVMPCYNEEASLPYTVPKLVESFREAGFRLELVLVNNGSTDRTADVIAELQARYPDERIVKHTVEVNEGYGNGVLRGLEVATGPWIGVIPADGQVDAEDVVRLFEAVSVTDSAVIGKVRRRFRMDGFRRKVVSIAYNAFARTLWPSIDSIDLNGTPKIIPRPVLELLELESRGWLLDPEIMIKAHYMGVRILEFNVFSRMRGNGLSHVRAETMWEFFVNLLRFRFSRRLLRWKEIRISHNAQPSTPASQPQ